MPFHYPLYKHHPACTLPFFVVTNLDKWIPWNAFQRNGFHGILFSYGDGPSMEKDFLYDVARMNIMDLG